MVSEFSSCCRRNEVLTSIPSSQPRPAPIQYLRSPGGRDQVGVQRVQVALRGNLGGQGAVGETVILVFGVSAPAGDSTALRWGMGIQNKPWSLAP